MSLAKLSDKHGSDKNTKHKYCEMYEEMFTPFKDKPIKLLEIGIGGYETNEGGNSLRMWKEWFSQAEIHGLDIIDKSQFNEDRIITHRGNQSDPKLLNKLGQFDIVIDDGSHYNPDQQNSFEMLFPLLAGNGIYVIEDLQTSYWESFGGSHNLLQPGTTLQYLKDRVDGLNWKEYIPNFGLDDIPYTAQHIKRITFEHNIVFIHKGFNLGK